MWPRERSNWAMRNSSSRIAEVDALADMYDAKCTTMSMLVSSSHPAEAGLQAVLAEMLLDYGAAFDDGPGTNWQSPIMTALRSDTWRLRRCSRGAGRDLTIQRSWRDWVAPRRRRDCFRLPISRANTSPSRWRRSTAKPQSCD